MIPEERKTPRRGFRSAACAFLLACTAVAGSSAQPWSPIENLTAFDMPNDAGRRIGLEWRLPSIPGIRPGVRAETPPSTPTPTPPEDRPAGGLRIFRAAAPQGPFELVGQVEADATGFIDERAPRDGTPYWYRVVAAGLEAAGDVVPENAPTVGPVRSRGQWFHTGRINTLVAVLVLSGLVMYFIRRAQRGGSIFIRKIAGLEAVDEAVGRATEMGRKVLFIPGSQDMDSVQTLAGISILGRVARMTAQYETSLEVPVSRSLVMVACRETVKEAYLTEGRPDAYNDSMVYYLTDDQFGYAAALEGLMMREKPATVFLQGLFYAEALLLAENGNAIGAIQIAGTAEASQLPFFVAACDYTLIGEELFLAGAYLSRDPRQLGSLKGQDMGKALILVLLLIGVILQTTGLFDFASLFVVQ